MIPHKFLERPNLPDNTVLHAVVSAQYPQIVAALEKSGVTVLAPTCCNSVLHPLRFHSDMLIAYLGGGEFAAERSQTALVDSLSALGFICRCDEVELKPEYPYDIALNCCIIGKYIICKSAAVPDLFKHGKTVIDVKQGYAKCSCAPVDENSLITDDPSIYSAATAVGLNVLLIGKGSVVLDGFDTGFIGGCCGKLSKDILAFCGDVSKHPDYARINGFLRECGVYPHSLTGGELIDVGSVIPVSQLL